MSTALEILLYYFYRLPLILTFIVLSSFKGMTTILSGAPTHHLFVCGLSQLQVQEANLIKNLVRN